MRLKISVELESGYPSGMDGHLEVKKMLILAQRGVIEKYIDRLVSAGSMPIHNPFLVGAVAATYVELRDEEKKET